LTQNLRWREKKKKQEMVVGGMFNVHAIPSLRGHEDLFKASLNVGVFKITDKPDKIKEKLTKKTKPK
jgi:hypothetical protein